MAKRRRSPQQARTARQEKLAEAHQAISDYIDSLTSGDDWKRWLDVAKRFRNYSLNNRLLIAQQRPEATAVMGYRDWQGIGRQVREDEKHIRILAPKFGIVGWRDPSGAVTLSDRPIRKNEVPAGCTPIREMVGALPVRVFDISQTDGEPLPQRPIPKPVTIDGPAPDGMREGLKRLVTEHGFTLTRQPSRAGEDGYTSYATKTVNITPGQPGAHEALTLAHEVAHMLMHDPEHRDPDEPGRHRGIAEVEAESVAYIIASEFGYDTRDNSFPYVAGWAGRDNPADVVRATAGKVIKTADRILNTIASTSENELDAPSDVTARADAAHDLAQSLNAETEREDTAAPTADVPVSSELSTAADSTATPEASASEHDGHTAEAVSEHNAAEAAADPAQPPARRKDPKVQRLPGVRVDSVVLQVDGQTIATVVPHSGDRGWFSRYEAQVPAGDNQTFDSKQEALSYARGEGLRVWHAARDREDQAEAQRQQGAAQRAEDERNQREAAREETERREREGYEAHFGPERIQPERGRFYIPASTPEQKAAERCAENRQRQYVVVGATLFAFPTVPDDGPGSPAARFAQEREALLDKARKVKRPPKASKQRRSTRTRPPRAGTGEFTPKPGAPGSTVTFTNSDGETVTGTVQAAAPGSSVWVTPEGSDTTVQVAFDRDDKTHGYQTRTHRSDGHTDPLNTREGQREVILQAVLDRDRGFQALRSARPGTPDEPATQAALQEWQAGVAAYRQQMRQRLFPHAPAPAPSLLMADRDQVITYVLGDHTDNTLMRELVSAELGAHRQRRVIDELRGGVTVWPGKAATELARLNQEVYRRALAAAAGRGERVRDFDAARAVRALQRLADGDPTLPVNLKDQDQYVHIDSRQGWVLDRVPTENGLMLRCGSAEHGVGAFWSATVAYDADINLIDPPQTAGPTQQQMVAAEDAMHARSEQERHQQAEQMLTQARDAFTQDHLTLSKVEGAIRFARAGQYDRARAWLGDALPGPDRSRPYSEVEDHTRRAVWELMQRTDIGREEFRTTYQLGFDGSDQLVLGIADGVAAWASAIREHAAADSAVGRLMAHIDMADIADDLDHIAERYAAHASQRHEQRTGHRVDYPAIGPSTAAPAAQTIEAPSADAAEPSGREAEQPAPSVAPSPEDAAAQQPDSNQHTQASSQATESGESSGNETEYQRNQRLATHYAATLREHQGIEDGRLPDMSNEAMDAAFAGTCGHDWYPVIRAVATREHREALKGPEPNPGTARLRGKQHGIRVDASIRRSAQRAEQQRRQEAQDRAAQRRAQQEALTPVDPSELDGAVLVYDRKHPNWPREVVRVNRTTVSVISAHGLSKPDRIPKNRIYRVRKPDVDTSSAAPESGEASEAAGEHTSTSTPQANLGAASDGQTRGEETDRTPDVSDSARQEAATAAALEHVAGTTQHVGKQPQPEPSAAAEHAVPESPSSVPESRAEEARAEAIAGADAGQRDGAAAPPQPGGASLPAAGNARPVLTTAGVVEYLTTRGWTRAADRRGAATWTLPANNRRAGASVEIPESADAARMLRLLVTVAEAEGRDRDTVLDGWHEATREVHARTVAEAEGRDRDTVRGELVDDARERMARVNAAAATWFSAQLDDSTVANAYLRRSDRLGSREAVDAVRARFTLGYAPPSWQGLVDHLQQQGFTWDELMAAGVASVTGRATVIDRFRHRITCAVYDHSGRIAGFTARDVAGDQQAKYLNTRTTLLFAKSEVLFGAWEQRELVTSGEVDVAVMEGPFDVFGMVAASSLAGHEPVVATAACGKAITDAHLAQLGALFPSRSPAMRRVLFVPDGEPEAQAAGLEASHRALQRIEQRIDFVALPDEHDPLTWARQAGAESIQAYLDGSDYCRPALEAIVDATIAKWGNKLEFVDGQTEASRDVAGVLASVQHRMPVTEMAIATATRLGSDPAYMALHIATFRRESLTTDDQIEDAARQAARLLARLDSDVTYVAVQVATTLGIDPPEMAGYIASARHALQPQPSLPPLRREPAQTNDDKPVLVFDRDRDADASAAPTLQPPPVPITGARGPDDMQPDRRGTGAPALLSDAGRPTVAAPADTQPVAPGPAQPPAGERTRWDIALVALRFVWPQDADWIIASQTTSVERLGQQLDRARQAGYDPALFLRDALVASGQDRLVQPNEIAGAAAATTASSQTTTHQPGIPHPGALGTDPARFAERAAKKHLATLTESAPSTTTPPSPDVVDGTNSASTAETDSDRHPLRQATTAELVSALLSSHPEQLYPNELAEISRRWQAAAEQQPSTAAHPDVDAAADVLLELLKLRLAAVHSHVDIPFGQVVDEDQLRRLREQLAGSSPTAQASLLDAWAIDVLRGHAPAVAAGLRHGAGTLPTATWEALIRQAEADVDALISTDRLLTWQPELDPDATLTTRTWQLADACLVPRWAQHDQRAAIQQLRTHGQQLRTTWQDGRLHHAVEAAERGDLDSAREALRQALDAMAARHEDEHIVREAVADLLRPGPVAEETVERYRHLDEFADPQRRTQAKALLALYISQLAAGSDPKTDLGHLHNSLDLSALPSRFRDLTQRTRQARGLPPIRGHHVSDNAAHHETQPAQAPATPETRPVDNSAGEHPAPGSGTTAETITRSSTPQQNPVPAAGVVVTHTREHGTLIYGAQLGRIAAIFHDARLRGHSVGAWNPDPAITAPDGTTGAWRISGTAGYLATPHAVHLLNTATRVLQDAGVPAQLELPETVLTPEARAMTGQPDTAPKTAPAARPLNSVERAAWQAADKITLSGPDETSRIELAEIAGRWALRAQTRRGGHHLDLATSFRAQESALRAGQDIAAAPQTLPDVVRRAVTNGMAAAWLNNQPIPPDLSPQALQLRLAQPGPHLPRQQSQSPKQRAACEQSSPAFADGKPAAGKRSSTSRKGKPAAAKPSRAASSTQSPRR